jgi:hypothetical protein
MLRRREMRRGIWKEEMRLVFEHVPLSLSTDTIRGRMRSAFTNYLLHSISFSDPTRFISRPSQLHLSELLCHHRSERVMD